MVDEARDSDDYPVCDVLRNFIVGGGGGGTKVGEIHSVEKPRASSANVCGLSLRAFRTYAHFVQSSARSARTMPYEVPRGYVLRISGPAAGVAPPHRAVFPLASKILNTALLRYVRAAFAINRFEQRSGNVGTLKQVAGP